MTVQNFLAHKICKNILFFKSQKKECFIGSFYVSRRILKFLTLRLFLFVVCSLILRLQEQGWFYYFMKVNYFPLKSKIFCLELILITYYIHYTLYCKNMYTQYCKNMDTLYCKNIKSVASLLTYEPPVYHNGIYNNYMRTNCGYHENNYSLYVDMSAVRNRFRKIC